MAEKKPKSPKIGKEKAPSKLIPPPPKMKPHHKGTHY